MRGVTPMRSAMPSRKSSIPTLFKGKKKEREKVSVSLSTTLPAHHYATATNCSHAVGIQRSI
jgi:hypothetical protein